MSANVHFILLSSAPCITGMLSLRIASPAGPVRRQEFALAALLLLCPLVVWGACICTNYFGRQSHVSPTEFLLFAGYLDAVFFWFIWTLNSWTFEPAQTHENPWEENWGASYSAELKEELIASVFDRLDNEGKAGNLIVDIGSGASPVSRLLRSTPDRRFIFIDIAARNSLSPDSLHLRLNVETIMRPNGLGYRRALVRACRFLALNPRIPSKAALATTMVFSDILNYVDFRSILPGFAHLLEPGGRMIVINSPLRGIRELFSDRGLKKNEDLFLLLRERNLEIEFKAFPCRPKEETDESEEMLVLVARKGSRDSANGRL